MDGAIKEFQKIILLQRLQDIELATAQQRTNHLKRRVLRGGANEGDNTLLHSPQEGVLLRLGETMDLIDK